MVGDVPHAVTRIALGRGIFGVNCYLVKTGLGFVLVDTGTRKHRARLLKSLKDLGCEPDLLRLVFITHGDFDHIGSAAYLRRAFGVSIAMHQDDARMSANGDMFAGRQRSSRLARVFGSLVFRFPKEDRFEPDVLVDEDCDLAEYGLSNARVLLLRGHSAGSVGLLLTDGSLFCGDVLENRKRPGLGAIMDDPPTAWSSVDRLRTMEIGTVYPGHGEPFEFAGLDATR